MRVRLETHLPICVFHTMPLGARPGGRDLAGRCMHGASSSRWGCADVVVLTAFAVVVALIVASACLTM